VKEGSRAGRLDAARGAGHPFSYRPGEAVGVTLSNTGRRAPTHGASNAARSAVRDAQDADEPSWTGKSLSGRDENRDRSRPRPAPDWHCHQPAPSPLALWAPSCRRLQRLAPPPGSRMQPSDRESSYAWDSPLSLWIRTFLCSAAMFLPFFPIVAGVSWNPFLRARQFRERKAARCRPVALPCSGCYEAPDFIARSP